MQTEPRTDENPVETGTADDIQAELYYIAADPEREIECGHRHGSPETAWECCMDNNAETEAPEEPSWRPMRVAGGKRKHLWYVNEYTESLGYGGSEEGGWWFDQYEVEADHGRFETREDAETKVQSLQKYLADQRRGRYPAHVSISDGWPVLLIETHPPMHQPAHRPFYE